MPAGTGYFHKQPSYFYISFPTDFFDYRIFLLLSGKQSGHIFHISHKALFLNSYLYRLLMCLCIKFFLFCFSYLNFHATTSASALFLLSASLVNRSSVFLNLVRNASIFSALFSLFNFSFKVSDSFSCLFSSIILWSF